MSPDKRRDELHGGNFREWGLHSLLYQTGFPDRNIFPRGPTLCFMGCLKPRELWLHLCPKQDVAGRSLLWHKMLHSLINNLTYALIDFLPRFFFSNSEISAETDHWLMCCWSQKQTYSGTGPAPIGRGSAQHAAVATPPCFLTEVKNAATSLLITAEGDGVGHWDGELETEKRVRFLPHPSLSAGFVPSPGSMHGPAISRR